ncbi:MAG: hypothetical protein ACI9JY_001245, partial [Saprospiraceae bacterium]
STTRYFYPVAKVAKYASSHARGGVDYALGLGLLLLTVDSKRRVVDGRFY